ncbi:SLATT domain-containing protein [Paenibacillus sepulcri]|uniref:SLATT domain-containing protein n=1 Tax=Paenibacillus sepulcri TaxID=359917 RepID=UPI00361B56EE
MNGLTGGKWIGALLSLITAAFIAIQTFFNFQKQVEGHRSIASRYLVVSKECNRVEAYFIDKHFDPESLREQLENLSRVCNQINNDADAFPTSNTDYRIAQQGLNDGEELYTVSEKQRKGE